MEKFVVYFVFMLICLWHFCNKMPSHTACSSYDAWICERLSVYVCMYTCVCICMCRQSCLCVYIITIGHSHIHYPPELLTCRLQVPTRWQMVTFLEDMKIAQLTISIRQFIWTELIRHKFDIKFDPLKLRTGNFNILTKGLCFLLFLRCCNDYQVCFLS